MRILVLLLLAGCSGLKMDGDCVYERTVTTAYECQPGGKIEHFKIESVQ